MTGADNQPSVNPPPNAEYGRRLRQLATMLRLADEHETVARWAAAYADELERCGWSEDSQQWRRDAARIRSQASPNDGSGT